jgi:hypothetical protein
MHVNTATSAELLLKLHPDCTIAFALKEANRELEEGSMAAAAAWTRVAAILFERNPPTGAAT